MNTLNLQQRAVIAHGDTPALVLAGAGTGKTTVMAHRAAELLQRGLNPNRLLLLTFTRRASEELRERVSRVLQLGTLALPWCGTFHSIAVRLLRRHGEHIGVPSTFSIFDETDARDLLWKTAESVLDEVALEAVPAKGQLYRIYSYGVNTGDDVERVLLDIAPALAGAATTLERVFAAYVARKRAANGLDFDDLLQFWVRLLDAEGMDCARHFEAILVDEYQDTNSLQAKILQRLCRHHHNIMVVGDDAQAIYAFRGATVDNILRFEREYPGTVRLMLEENYRSHQEILDAANALLADVEADRGFRKNLQAVRGKGEHRPRLEPVANDNEQAERIAELIWNAWQEGGIPLREQAVLFRSSHHTFRLEMVLRRFGIPFRKYGGQRFADSAHIKDVLAFLRCRENPRDEAAWARILCMLPGVGDATAGKVYRKLIEAPTLTDALRAHKFGKAAAAYQDGLVGVFDLLFQEPPEPLQEQLAQIIDFCEPLLDRLYENPDQRLQGLKELQNLAAGYETRREFLDDMQVGDDSVLNDEDGGPQDHLTLSTVHSAKGCEWRQVFVMQLVEGGIPSGPSQDDAAKVDEERRLLYVAMTRAKERLYLLQPRWRETFDHGMRGVAPYKPSRFLTPAVMACLDTDGDNSYETDSAGGGAAAGDLVYEAEGDYRPSGDDAGPRRSAHNNPFARRENRGGGTQYGAQRRPRQRW